MIRDKLIQALKDDLIPSLGVTEPTAIAYAAAVAKQAVGGTPISVSAKLNSGIYKNSFTCAVPNSGGCGCALAAAMGAVCGAADKKLMCLEDATERDAETANALVKSEKATAELLEISSDIRIIAEVKTEYGVGICEITERHDHISRIEVNGQSILSDDKATADACSSIMRTQNQEQQFRVSQCSFEELYNAAECAEAEELRFISEAADMNLQLYECGEKTQGNLAITDTLTQKHGRQSALSAAVRYACGAIEARVRGADAPAMAIAGSGSHGILCMLPIRAAAKVDGISHDRETRAILLSCLVTMYIKECSGRLSAVCGCVLAGGTGAAVGLTYLYGGDVQQCAAAIAQMAASVTGMVCHGGNTGCTLKAFIGVDAAFAACRLALAGSGVDAMHGILAKSAETTMQNMGRVAHGMSNAEGCIIDILRQHKQ